MTVTSSLSAESRREAIRTELARRGRLELAGLADRWRVHPMTIRRDFEVLEREGVARRVRGGVVQVGTEAFARRQATALGAKRAIAGKLASLLPDGHAVGFDASTTVHQLAVTMPAVEGLSVVTNGLAAFDTLQQRPGVRAFLTGGEREEANLSLVGVLAVLAFEHFLLQRCFLSAASVDPELGTSESTTEEVTVKAALVRASRHVVLAVDSGKLGSRSFVRSLDFDRVDLMVTELPPGDPRLDAYRDKVELL
jgi:DeoR family fructose operon transcriptional repressor